MGLFLAFVLDCLALNFLTLVWLYGFSKGWWILHLDRHPKQRKTALHGSPLIISTRYLDSQLCLSFHANSLTYRLITLHLPCKRPYPAKWLMFFWNTAVFHGKTSVQYFMAVFHDKTSVQLLLIYIIYTPFVFKEQQRLQWMTFRGRSFCF